MRDIMMTFAEHKIIVDLCKEWYTNEIEISVHNTISDIFVSKISLIGFNDKKRLESILQDGVYSSEYFRLNNLLIRITMIIGTRRLRQITKEINYILIKSGITHMGKMFKRYPCLVLLPILISIYTSKKTPRDKKTIRPNQN